MAYLRLSQVAMLGALVVLAAVSCTKRSGADASDDSSTSGSSTTEDSGYTPGASSGGGGDTTGSETSTSDPGGRVEIAFTRESQGATADIFGMEMDGSNVRQLTFQEEAAWFPRWAPDGSVLAFSRETPEGWVSEIWLIDPESGDETYLATEESVWWGAAEWSPGGGHIAFASGSEGDPEIYAVSVDGTTRTNLTNDPGIDRSPSWPEGGRIFFASDRSDMGYEIYSMDENGSDPTALTNNAVDDTYPVASPDGSRVAFVRTEGEIQDLWVMIADGTAQFKITDSAPLLSHPDARWSPDGRYIAFTGNEAGQKAILRVDADGTGLTDLSDWQGSDELPRWTPDSEQIVFVSTRDDENGEIYIMNADGSNLTRLTNDPGWDTDPVVRPSG